LKTTRTRKSSKHQAPLLFAVAESIGSTLGTIAAKAGAAQKALRKRNVVGKLEREGKKLVQTGKRAARNLKKGKLGRKARRSLRRTSTKRAASRRARAKK
jgi:hypothetical protein